MLQEKDEGNI